MKTRATVHEGDFTAYEVAKVPSYQAYQILRFGFVVAPVLAGLDKFFMKLTDWSQYVWAPVANLVGGTQRFLTIVGVIEILAGLLVAFKPRIGAYVVALWLWGIIVNLFLIQNYYDVVLRDFGLSLGALALGRLAAEFDLPQKPQV